MGTLHKPDRVKIDCAHEYRLTESFQDKWYVGPSLHTTLRERLRTNKVYEIYLNFQDFLTKIICCGYLFESPRGGDSNRYPPHIILRRKS